MDQRFAMQWAQSNVKAFGGNPNKVKFRDYIKEFVLIFFTLVSNKIGYFGWSKCWS